MPSLRPSSHPPQNFARSLQEFETYPEALILESTNAFSSNLKNYKTRLNTAEENLFQPQEKGSGGENLTEVHFRDLQLSSGEVYQKEMIYGLQRLKEWLGVEFNPDSSDASKQIALLTERFPKCRLIYMYGQSSRSRLKITRKMFTLIMTFYQVMPVYLDFISVFGAQDEGHDTTFSGFREQTILRDPPRGPMMLALGRSGKQYQLCYNLKGVTLKTKNPTETKLTEWSIRHTAIHHQFDIVYGTTLWIITKGDIELQQRFKNLTGTSGRPEDKSFDSLEECFRSSLAAHLMYCNWSTEDWRWYIRWLEKIIKDKSDMAVLGPRGPRYAHKQYRPYDIQDIQYWQDKTNEVVMVMEGNVEVMNALRKYYLRLKDNELVPDEVKVGCADGISEFAARVDDIVSDFNMQISRARLLSRIIGDRKELILQHLQGQLAERTERLSSNMEKEAIVMRIITVATLLYLPATFVSTFFSTDVIKYQNPQGGPPGRGSFSNVALYRWLALSLPLTALTLLVAWRVWKISEWDRFQKERKPRPEKISEPLEMWIMSWLAQKGQNAQLNLPLHV